MQLQLQQIVYVWNFMCSTQICLKYIYIYILKIFPSLQNSLRYYYIEFCLYVCVLRMWLFEFQSKFVIELQDNSIFLLDGNKSIRYSRLSYIFHMLNEWTHIYECKYINTAYFYWVLFIFQFNWIQLIQDLNYVKGFLVFGR